MVEKACLLVATIGSWQACRIAGSIEAIEGVKRIDRVASDPNTLVVAIEGESGPILRQIGRVSGVIYARPAGE